MIKTKGLTLVEVLIATAIALGLLSALADFGKNTFGLGRGALANMDAQLDARRTLKIMLGEIRLANSLVATGTSTLEFLADLEDDGTPETVRYYLNGSTLMREAGGVQSTLMNRAENAPSTPVFEYQGEFVGINIISEGKVYASGAAPRNLDDHE